MLIDYNLRSAENLLNYADQLTSLEQESIEFKFASY